MLQIQGYCCKRVGSLKKERALMLHSHRSTYVKKELRPRKNQQQQQRQQLRPEHSIGGQSLQTQLEVVLVGLADLVDLADLADLADREKQELELGRLAQQAQQE